jgi:hypothetical protein
MKKNTLILAAISILFAACQSESHSHAGHGESSGPDAPETSSELSQNQGEKWMVNEDMMVYVRQMETRLDQFQGGGAGEVAALAADLQTDLQNLTGSCTMKGEAHDALHLWLHPFTEAVNQLDEEYQPEKTTAQIENLKGMLDTFHEKFQ